MNVPFDFVRAPYNDIAGTQAVLDSLPADSLAAVLVEPGQGAGGCNVGDPEFLKFLRSATEKMKALLIFDEVMTSRLAWGGMQTKLGIKPDLTTMGKWIGGGMTFGGFGGRKDIMSMFDPRSPSRLDHSGTFNNNIFTMAAGVAGFSILTADVLKRLNDLGDLLRTSISAAILKFREAGNDNEPMMYVTGMGSMLNVRFRGEEAEVLQALFFHHMLENGIYVAPRGYMALSIEIKPEHTSRFAEVLEWFVDKYQAILF